MNSLNEMIMLSRRLADGWKRAMKINNRVFKYSYKHLYYRLFISKILTSAHMHCHNDDVLEEEITIKILSL